MHAPIQRLEAGDGGKSMTPPEFNLTAGSTDQEEPELAAQKNMEEQGQNTDNMEQGEQLAMGKMSQSLSGESESVMTKDSLPLPPSQLPPKIYNIFNFKGVRFVVYDVGGDKKANSRKVLGQAIALLRSYDPVDAKKQKPTKTVRLYIGDYKAMRAYIKASPKLPYDVWLSAISKYSFGKPFAEFDKDGNNNSYNPSTAGTSFVPTYASKVVSLEKQRKHYAAFIDMSQSDKFFVDAKDPLLKQAADLAYIIAHEGTHTLLKQGSHGTDLMADGGALDLAVQKATKTDPKTGKQKLDIKVYMDEVFKMLAQFGKKY